MRRDELPFGLGLLGLISVVAACGGSVVEGAPPGEEGGAGGSSAGAGGSHAGAGGSHAGSGGMAGWGGYAGSAGTTQVGGAAGAPIDAGPPQHCEQTHEQFKLTGKTWDGKYIGCNGGDTDNVFEIQGVVTQSTGNSFELDSCPPNADCMQMLSSFSFEAPGLYAYVPQGGFVKVRISVRTIWACVQQIEVTNLPSWGGVSSPYGSQETIYLSASDGEPYTVPGSVIAVHTLPQGCAEGSPPACAGDPTDSYALSFAGIQQSSLGEPVYMGTQGMFMLPDAEGDQWLMVRNLRSYASGACDDYNNWGFWIAQAVWGEDDSK